MKRERKKKRERKGKDCVHKVFALKRTAEKQEKMKECFSSFINLEKAYDSVKADEQRKS